MTHSLRDAVVKQNHNNDKQTTVRRRSKHAASLACMLLSRGGVRSNGSQYHSPRRLPSVAEKALQADKVGHTIGPTRHQLTLHIYLEISHR